MIPTLRTSLRFALMAFATVLGIDVLLSFVFQSPPPQQARGAFLASHGLFHLAVLTLSALGSTIGFTFIRRVLPTHRQLIALAFSYGLVSAFAAVGSFMLAGPWGAVAWLLLGSMSFAIGAPIFSKPWRRTSIE